MKKLFFLILFLLMVGKSYAANCTNEPIAMCASLIGGCQIISSQIGQELDNRMAKYLSSQACEIASAQYQGQNYNLEDALGTLAVDLADDWGDSMLESDSGWEKVFGATLKLAAIGKKVFDFKKCVSIAERKCLNIPYSGRSREYNSIVPRQEIVIEETPVKVVKNYYSYLNTRSADSALNLWEPAKVTNNFKTRLYQLIEDIEWFKVNKAEIISIYGNNATIYIDTTGKNFGKSRERWIGSIHLVKIGAYWKIETQGKLKKISFNPTNLNDVNSAELLVINYYKALSENNADAAIKMWYAPSMSLQAIIRKLTQNVEYFNTKEVELVNLESNSALVSVYVIGKQRNNSEVEHWKGLISLSNRQGNWKISKLLRFSKNN